jgi:ATP-dependent helicase/nuclease subunit B
MSTLSLGLAEPLFGGPAPRLRSAPASAVFLDLLAEEMVAALWRKDDPFALADALVLVPNQRAARGLVDAFATRLGGAALLPAIRPLGDPHADEDPDVWGAEPINAAMAPPIEAMQRRLALASLVRAWSKANGETDDTARALALADELARLLDSAAAVERVHWERLGALVQEIELARHWARAADFLRIVTTYWPQHLKDVDRSDAGAHGAQLRRMLAERWSQERPTRPIVIAGSTGSIASTRDLMRVVAGLPRGVVVLPGLDGDLDDSVWDMVGDQHPQFALKATLAALGVSRRDVAPLAPESDAGRARRVLMREALAPAEKTADWLLRLREAGGARLIADGARGLRLLEAATEDEEAMAIALMLREAIERKRTAAVVTPDAGLARRIEAKLVRWGVVATASHGVRLRETGAGRLLALMCELAGDESEPVGLAAFIKHPLVLCNKDALATLEHAGLRGPRRYETFAELQALVSKSPGAVALVEAVEAMLAPVARIMRRGETTLAAFADAVAEACELAGGEGVWAGRDGENGAGLVREVIADGAMLGEMAPHMAARTLMRLMDGREVSPALLGDGQVAIWGLLEARLQRRDLMILAGLNEGVWPAPALEDPFLSRPMRAALGLPSLDQRIGLAAHDFAQLANAPDVVLTRSMRRDGAPTLASRWLWRLQTLLKGAGAALELADTYIAWAQAIDEPAQTQAARPPQPRPPVGKRLTRIGVTGVETLIRDPYAVYARRILGLEALKPIGAAPGPAERGTAVHDAIEQFGDGDDVQKLLWLLDDALRRQGIAPERRAAERERMAASAEALIAWFRSRGDAAVYRETLGALEVEGVRLTGKADRIEIVAAGGAILDFKTGDPPKDGQVASGLAPQLPLEAAMLARGAFDGVPAVRAEALIYWRFGGADPKVREVKFETSAYEAGEDALAALGALLRRYAQADQPFLCKPRVQFIKPYNEYDLLARRKEWADAEGET